MTDATDDILRVYDAYFPEIYGFCVRRLFDKSLVDDTTSEVFLRLAEQFRAMQGKTDIEIRNWLYGTARNIITRHLRQTRHQNAMLPELARRGRGEVEPNSEKLDWPMVHEALCSLGPKYQDVVVLRFFQQLSTLEIANALGMRHVTVRVMLSRAVKQLRRRLGKAFGEQNEEHGR